MNSILQFEKKCWFCDSPYIEEHHIYFGKNRKISEQNGFKVWLCNFHHTGSISGNSKNAVHFNKKKDLELKKYCQEKFEETHTREEFMQLIGENFL